MKPKIYITILIALGLIFSVTSQISAQTTVSTTGFTNNNANATILFNFRNNNPTGVIITNIASICGSTGQKDVSAYYKTSAINGAPGAISVANGWNQFGSAVIAGIANTTTTTTQPFMSGLSLLIPAGATYGICVQAVDQGTTIAALRYSTIAAGIYTFSGGGCDIITGTNIGYGGIAVPGAPTFTPRGYLGSVTFVSATQPCAQNFDGVVAPALPLNWTASTPTTCGGSLPWATDNTVSNSAPNSAFTNDPNCISDEVLDSRIFPIVSASAQLTFRNSYDLELTFDGMVLEISIGGGPFTDIITAGGSFVAGGYNGVISNCCGNPISGRNAWTGNSGGFIITTVNLPAAANGQNVVIRWRRATDSSVSDTGAWIDDVTLSGSDCTGDCVVTCPANITVSNTANQCGAIVNYPAPATNGACGPVTTSPASGSFFPVGLTTVTASTFSGPNCTFTVRVNDVQLPIITCPANITVSNSPGQCGAAVTFTPTATDNCPGVVITSVPASGSFFPIGTTTITSTARDASNNTATCTFTVTVNDTENPAFTAPGLFPERLYYKFDGSGTTVPNLATAPPAGTTTATLTGLTQGSTGKCGTALVGTGGPSASNNLNTNWITNMTPPWTISFWLGPNQVDMNPSYLFGAVTAGSFRCFYGGAALTNNVLLRGGTSDVLITGVNPGATLITIVYNGTNTVVYKNGGSPQTYNVTFNNIGTTPFYVGGYNTTAATASMNGRMDEFSLYTRALTAAEVLNIYNTCPVNINNCPSNITVNNAAGTCGAVVNYTTPVGVDNCPGTVTTQIAGLPSGSTFPVGTTTNTFRATDAVGNTANCTFNVTVVDAQAPTITCPANITVNTPVGSCTAVVNYTVTSTDNCPGVTQALQSGLASGATYPLGVTTNTWRATDASGNTSACTFTVTVLDVQLPVITAQPTNRFICVGSNAVFSVTATNVVTYQWQAWNGTAWVNIAGANASTLTLNSVTLSMNTNSYRVIINGLCTTNIISNVATLYVNTLPTIDLVASQSPLLIPGQRISITAAVSPAGGTISWFKNNVLMSGVTSFTLSNLSVDDVGTYRAVYTDLNGCVKTSADLSISAQATDKLWVYPNPTSGRFQVRFYNQVNEPVTLNIYDSKGAKVYQRKLVTTIPYSRIDVDLGKNSSGSYIVEIRDSKNIQVGGRQVVIQH